MGKAERGAFLQRNPFPKPYTLGFYYREKMRAIHQVTPGEEFARVLELGGGQSGLTRLLFPNSAILTLDADAAFGHAPCNLQPDVRFVCGDAEHLPFADESFDAVTMFDVLEHIPNDHRAMAEAMRVVRTGGPVLISTPNPNWRFPFYRVMQPLCPAEAAVMSEWGHVRRGYSLTQLQQLAGVGCEAAADFINKMTVLSHDIAFSRLPGAIRRLSCMLLWPLTWMGYALHRRSTWGTETASCWRKQGRGQHGI
ncbi:MAG TPA: class I SAM-dependent methyltransferase [Bryobacteraceae bacterium]|nr:class I SAM-dependent methyltransferase [Bryobacteraceae bacterium]